jgi:hypothetical protein
VPSYISPLNASKNDFRRVVVGDHRTQDLILILFDLDINRTRAYTKSTAVLADELGQDDEAHDPGQLELLCIRHKGSFHIPH